MNIHAKSNDMIMKLNTKKKRKENTNMYLKIKQVVIENP